MSLDRRLREYLKRYRAPRDVAAYFAANPVRKLNIGCGSNIVAGWLNVDSAPQPGAVYLDGRKSWPYPTGSFAAVLCEHVMEHVPKPDGATLLAEAFRVLQPGGYLRMATPDQTFLGRLAAGIEPGTAAYVAALSGLFGRSDMTPCDAVNIAFYSYGHCYIYSPAELRAAIEKAGFVDLVETRAGRPVQEIFRGAEGHGGVIGDEINALEAFAFEARRPGGSAAS